MVVGVRDAGPGIAPEDQERIFDRFTRLPQEDATPGSGLGLFIARSLVEAQGGTISVELLRGRGGHVPRRPPRRLGGPVRTLIIDDDPDHREVVRTLLERAGLGPSPRRRTVAAGLAAVAARHPELVLLDIDMPGPSGLDVLPELVRLAPAARVVMLSNFPRRLHGDGGDGCEARPATWRSACRCRDLVREILLAAAIAETALEVAARAPRGRVLDPGGSNARARSPG